MIKRLSNRWYTNASYTYSSLRGNYSGLSSSDENGRNSPSVNRFFDGQYMSFDQTGEALTGDLGTDHPHQFEVPAAYQMPLGTQIGAYYLIGGGLPQIAAGHHFQRSGFQPWTRRHRSYPDLRARPT